MPHLAALPLICLLGCPQITGAGCAAQLPQALAAQPPRGAICVAWDATADPGDDPDAIGGPEATLAICRRWCREGEVVGIEDEVGAPIPCVEEKKT